MTTTAISSTTDSSRRRPLRADLVFWTAAGALVAALSGPLSHSWAVPRAVLLDVGLVFAIVGPLMLLGLRRMRLSSGLVAAFVVTNFALAPLALAAAGFDWLGLTRAGNWALADAGLVMLVLGIWQYVALRSLRR
ncbi:hypothetical protein [Mycobacterium paraterrae]|uniref:Integral membrane protein n=1 Tax=Mycobacterium paraterrae TaxID=577492 RepID=A0ABY3VE31_9MYCO|nr:hypothetical protein [Mycobacterium paraterrae]UMB67693.1 hypothetical protein MKK62_14385 [Mycobacterium paraterrae]